MISKKLIDKLIRRKPFVTLFQASAPGFSRCAKCGLPWKYADGHDVNYTDSRSFFVMCRYCWERATNEEIDKAIRELVESWGTDSGYTLQHYLQCAMMDKAGNPLFVDEYK